MPQCLARRTSRSAMKVSSNRVSPSRDHSSSCCASLHTRPELNSRSAIANLNGVPAASASSSCWRSSRGTWPARQPDLHTLIFALRREASVAVAAHRVPGDRAVFSVRTRTRRGSDVEPAQLVDRPRRLAEIAAVDPALDDDCLSVTLRGRVLVDLAGRHRVRSAEACSGVLASRATGHLAWTTAGGSSTPVSDVQHRSER